jgi:hypothetical protein
MDAAACRKRALLCQMEADRSWGVLRDKFLETAAEWNHLADEIDQRENAAPIAPDIARKLGRSPDPPKPLPRGKGRV